MTYKSYPQRLIQALAIFSIILSFEWADASYCTEAILKEFLDPQDSFTFTRTSPTEAILRCHFQKNRFRIRQLALALPEDVTLNWRFMSGTSNNNGKEIVLPATGDDNANSWVSLKRMWLADIPMVAVRFQKTSPAASTSNNTKQTTGDSFANILDATFALTFSRPCGDPTPATQTLDGKDPFLQIAKNLVVNPDDLLGSPRPLPTPETSLIPPLSLFQNESSCRITVSRPGVVSFSAKDLSNVGFDCSLLDARYLSLFHLGKPYPLTVMSTDPVKIQGDDRIWFFCPSVGTDETLTSTYYLGWGTTPGTRISAATDVMSASGSPLSPASQPGSSTIQDWDWRMIQIEQDNPEIYVDQDTLAAPVDLFWQEIRREEDSLTTDFDLPGLVDSEIIRGETSSSSSILQVHFEPPENFRGDGTFHIILNEIALAEATLPSTTKMVSLEVPSGLLRRRGNRLNISFRGKIPPLTDQAHGLCLDWVRIWFPGRWDVSQGLVAIDHRPLIGAHPEASPTLAHWNIPSGTGDWRFVRFNGGGENSSMSMCQPRQEGTTCLGPSSHFSGQWWLVDLNQSNPPEKIELCTGTKPLHDDTHQADLLVVTDSRFVSQLQEYLGLTQQRGISSRIVTTQEIYEEFSHGEKSIQAIRDFCEYAFTHYQSPRPQYLWLVGEARWDPTNRLRSHVEDLVPSPALHTRGVIHSNDQWYVYLKGDDALPDLLVSRVSVGATTELEAYLRKVKEDLQDRQLGWWRTTSLFLTDDGFSEEVETSLRNGFNQVCIPKLIRQEEYPLDPFRKFEAVGRVGKEARGIRNDVVREWSDGARLVEYVGHGGITVWSHESLFKGLNRPDSDVDRLSNKGKYSFVNIRSCMSASVNWPTFPGEVSVSEALIKAPGRGAIGVLGSSGTEFATDQERFGAQFRAGVWNHHIDSLAAVRAYAQCQFMLQTPELKGVVDQFLLHGDPTLPFDFPKTLESLELAWKESPEGPRLQAGWSGGLPSGKGQVRLYNFREMVYESEPFDIPQATQTVTLPVPPAIPFKLDLTAALYLWNPATHRDAFRVKSMGIMHVNGKSWPSLYHSWVKPVTGVEPEVSEIVLSPTDPVVGEPVLLTVQVHNNAQDLIKVLNSESKAGNDPDSMKKIEQEIRKKGGYPWHLFPGETRTFQWLQSANNQPGEMNYMVDIHLPGKTISRSAKVMIETPPEIKILELRPLEQREAYSASEPLRMLVRAQNVGGRPTQPLRLVCSEMRWNQSAAIMLPPLSPAQIYDVTFAIVAPQTVFDWETKVDLLPKALTSRIRWHRQSFRSEVPREITLPLESNGTACSRGFASSEDLASFTQRSLESGDITVRIADDALFTDYPVMNLDLLDTAEVHSATHAGVAAWQNQVGWWLSPFQLQAHPLWSGKPFKARLPWDKPPSLALISPTYYKHNNYQSVGFPMPSATIESSGCRFELTPANTQDDGRFPPQLIEIQAPGIEWTISNHRGAWPGFSGFRMAALPEILSPVIRLPEDSQWKPEFSVEWIPEAPKQATCEIRWKKEGAEWTPWSPLTESTVITGNQAQIRYWVVPDDTLKGALIRSLKIRFGKTN